MSHNMWTWFCCLVYVAYRLVWYIDNGETDMILPVLEMKPVKIQIIWTRTKPPPIARFLGRIWGPSGADRTQMGPMLAPWTLLSWTKYHVQQELHEYKLAPAIISQIHIPRLIKRWFGINYIPLLNFIIRHSTYKGIKQQTPESHFNNMD